MCVPRIKVIYVHDTLRCYLCSDTHKIKPDQAERNKTIPYLNHLPSPERDVPMHMALNRRKSRSKFLMLRSLL